VSYPPEGSLYTALIDGRPSHVVMAADQATAEMIVARLTGLPISGIVARPPTEAERDAWSYWAAKFAGSEAGPAAMPIW
jgi:hypothetical protein